MQLVIVDTTQIQSYIFSSGSSRMRENIGASYLVAQATGQWALDLIPKPNNIRDAEKFDLDDNLRIEQEQNLAAEVLYAGGGNVVILFRDEPQATLFVRQLSSKVLQLAPRLQLVIANFQFDWHDSLAEAVRKGLTEEIANQKRSGATSAPLLGLGVTAVCKSTGLPAVGLYGNGNDLYSAETLAKLQYREASQISLNKQFPLDKKYTYPNDLDNLGRSHGEESHLAIVHADGNGMGKKIQAIADNYLHPKDNRDYILALRHFSQHVSQASQVALENVIKKLLDVMQSYEEGGAAIRYYNRSGTLLGEIVMQQEKEGDKRFYVPFRPLVYGGDDVTFVCDARIGISLAVDYLEQFEEQTQKFVGEKLTACAGIAIVKSHYPFARAYYLSERLCKSAKKFRKEKDQDGKVGSALDWYFAMSSIYGEIGDMRKREYQIIFADSQDNHYLTLCPVALNPQTPLTRQWKSIEQVVFDFQDKEKDKRDKKDKSDKKVVWWSTRRNKLKALREALRDGPEAVKQFRLKFSVAELPEITDVSSLDYRQTGWYDRKCLYFDAIELMDWFIPLEKNQNEEKPA